MSMNNNTVTDTDKDMDIIHVYVRVHVSALNEYHYFPITTRPCKQRLLCILDLHALCGSLPFDLYFLIIWSDEHSLPLFLPIGISLFLCLS